MKTCTKCHIPKKLDEFVKDKRRADGHGSWCLECSRIYMRALIKTPKVRAARKEHYETNKADINAKNRERWANNKDRYALAAKRWHDEHRGDLLVYYKDRGEAHRAFLDTLKQGALCQDCVQIFPPYVMEYDHVRGEKRFNLGKMANHRREAVLAEIEKCELVCCACHRVRTQNRKGDSDIPKLQIFHNWVNGLKANPCTDCGRVLPPVAMDFDHIGDDKVAGIAQMWSWGRERVLAELAKCELVCANCHRIRTQIRRPDRRAA